MSDSYCAVHSNILDDGYPAQTVTQDLIKFSPLGRCRPEEEVRSENKCLAVAGLFSSGFGQLRTWSTIENGGLWAAAFDMVVAVYAFSRLAIPMSPSRPIPKR